jgi:hypothetical protein
MLTIEELESACDVSEQVELPRHEIDAADMPLHGVFFPYGFPVEVRTNSELVLHQIGEMWGMFEKQHDTEPIQCDIQLVEGESAECPPEPTYQFMLPLMICVADSSNYSIVDLDRCRMKATISRAALRHPLYAKYFLLGTAICCVSTRYATPVHAGCVELDGRGVLLCGDSGAGKSSLSYACARAGWTYVSDDASYLLNGGSRRLITGNCHQVRFRPTAVQLFPELNGLEITPRAAGKPSIELPTAPMANIARAQTTRVDFIVFLNRRTNGPSELLPYRKDVARQFMRQTLYGSAETLAVQYEAIEHLLTANLFELRYSDLDWAVDRLRQLVQEGL